MNLTTEILLGIMILLCLILVFAIIIYLQTNKVVVKKNLDKKCLTLLEIKEIIMNRKSTREQLEEAVNTIVDIYRVINDMDEYDIYIKYLCVHPNVSSKLILYFDKELRFFNPKYKKHIEKSVQHGMHARKIR